MTTWTVTFDTKLGRCAVRWTEAGISGVLLPTAGGRSGPRLEDGASVPPFVSEAINGMVAVMAGEARDLRGVPIGALTGFSAPGGLATKRRMLMLEGATTSCLGGSAATTSSPLRAGTPRKTITDCPPLPAI
jgi:hypothetical protein